MTELERYGAAIATLFVIQVWAFRRRAKAKKEQLESLHFNPGAGRSLPPVGCPLLIKVDDRVMKVHRTSHIQRPDGDMEYITENGLVLVGRYDWTYP
ncbi:hypothetical protein ACIPL1_27470 [Pseudomonas sp. NPDC090202]|uniref:hypothetical protein n=1 Tax=Pseudomonas sp. NPDC090202 TaxID=3364476 RepID=UPI0038076A73